MLLKAAQACLPTQLHGLRNMLELPLKALPAWTRLGRRRRGSWRAPIRSEVGNRHIAFMANTRNHWDRARGYTTSQRFIVKGPQVLDRTPSPHKQQNITILALVRLPKCLNQFLGRRQPLDRCRINDHRNRWHSLAEGCEHIAKGCGLQGRNDANGPRQLGQNPLSFLIEETLCLELLFETKKLQLQVALTCGTHLFDLQLDVTTRLINRELR